MNQNNKIENLIKEDEINFKNSINNIFQFSKTNILKILLLYFINLFVFFSILFFFFFKDSYKITAELDIPDSSYWGVIFSAKYQFYFDSKNPYHITNHYIKKNFLYILNDYKKNNKIDDSFTIIPSFKHNNDEIYIQLTFESQNEKFLNDFFYHFIDQINFKFNLSTNERMDVFLETQLDTTFETQIALENIVEEYELRADDFTLAQIFAYNLHSNPALIKLRLEQLKESVTNNKKLLDNYNLLNPINIKYYSDSINDYTFFIIILSIFALILEIVVFRFFTLLNK